MKGQGFVRLALGLGVALSLTAGAQATAAPDQRQIIVDVAKADRPLDRF